MNRRDLNEMLGKMHWVVAYLMNDHRMARRFAAAEGVRTWTRYPLTIAWDPTPWASEWRAWNDDEGCRYLRLGRVMLCWHACQGTTPPAYEDRRRAVFLMAMQPHLPRMDIAQLNEDYAKLMSAIEELGNEANEKGGGDQ
jgi:hypothetical protein